MMKKSLIIFILIFKILPAQELPYGVPNYFELSPTGSFYKINLSVPSLFPNDILNLIEPIHFKYHKIYFLELKLEKVEAFHFELINSLFSENLTLNFIDLNTTGWVGPYTKNIIVNNSPFISGQMKTDRILIEISIPIGQEPKFPIQKILHPKRPKHFEQPIPIRTLRSRESNNKILLCGYWPPSNECIRPFSRNELFNPNGWIGENWEDSGYDIVSFFPNFTPPDCDNCGQGNGDLEVDYQDTSDDWWNIVDSINPIAIITFSRGYIDYSWEMEWKYYNSINWVPDFTPPTLPTPSPPDSTWPTNSPRFSSLPLDSIVAAIDSANLGLNPYIDYSNGAGNYLSEFLGYHGVWYKAQMDSADVPCYTVGHVHVGGLIGWETAHEAAKITLREVIKVVDEFKDLPGDVNEDGVVSIMDMLLIISHILGYNILSENEEVLADINIDSVIDIYDLMLISNIILDFN
jgi:hypothetical protein